MSVHINIARAKAHLSDLVARAEAGEDVIICRDGKPAVSLKPCEPPPSKARRQLGFWAHLGPMRDPDLFLRPDPDLEALMDNPIDPAA